jgi:predicted kinase
MQPTLYIFGGLPGTGKTVLSRALARRLRAAHLRVDNIEQTLRNCDIALRGPEGYLLAYELAAENLRLGVDVVADSVNPLELTREAWREVARRRDVACVEIEVVCSDRAEHRRRIESRISDVIGLRLPTWQDVTNREYEPWTGLHIVVDTAGRSVDESVAALNDELARVDPLDQRFGHGPRDKRDSPE